ncbi:MAG TPA: tetratricopeptide repeat protein [Bryobacteraceae bacterium]|nr:tetratricopeptide repeat protein [Bryobacteraceae bacterium]
MKRGTTIAVLVIVVICLAAMDQFLARIESSEMRKTAQQSYAAGVRLMQAGKVAEAVDSLRNAHTLERENTAYELELIAALTAAGKADDAEPLLTEVLQREPNDGRANLIAARLMVRRGNITEAESYYHRAIYGTWPGDSAESRESVRMELVNLLAELISLDAQSPPPEIRKRLAELYLVAGSPGRAVNIYQSFVAQDPNDIAAYEGLGDAEIEQGQYGAAHDAFRRAALRDPENASVRARLEMLNIVTGLDPTRRQLTSAEKYRRSLRILKMARDEAGRCAATSPSASAVLTSGANRGFAAAGDAIIASRAPAHATNEAAEAVLSLAEKLWQASTAACGNGNLPEGRSPDRDALVLLMKKLAA